MGLEGTSEASGVKSENVEREDPEAREERQSKELEEARNDRAKRLGHEIFEEEGKKEKEPAKKAAASKKSE